MKELFLCVDNSGGLCDRICLGTEGLINNANTSIECWNSLETEESETFKPVEDYENALSILNTDNFEVIKMKEGNIYLLENVALDYSNNNLISFVDERLIRVIKVEEIKFSDNGTYNIY